MAEEKKAIELDDEALDEVAGGAWESDLDMRKAYDYLEKLEIDGNSKVALARMTYRQWRTDKKSHTFDEFKNYVDGL